MKTFKTKFLTISLIGTLGACSSLTRSISLGASSGLAVGGGSGALMQANSSKQRLTNSAIGAGIGLGIGILSSYLLHKNTEKRIKKLKPRIDERIRFGDLPPNPFSPDKNSNPFHQN